MKVDESDMLFEMDFNTIDGIFQVEMKKSMSKIWKKN